MELELIRGIWDYHGWGHRKLFGEATSLSEATATKEYKSTDGTPYAEPLWPLLQHVVNHATHHRSEIATMVTMTKGSPALTDMVLFYRQPKG